MVIIAENHMGTTVGSASGSADSTADMGRDVAENTDRPGKKRRVDESSRGCGAITSCVWDGEGSDGGVRNGDIDAGGDENAEELFDDDFADGGLSEDEFADEEADETSEETPLRHRRMEPNVESLLVRRIPGSVSGEEMGSYVGENTQLKNLTIEGESINWVGEPRTLEWFSEFCTGLSDNRSIDHLSLNGCNLHGETTANAIARLSPFFELNSNLQSVQMTSCNVGDDIVRLLASALSRRCNKSSLRRINLDSNLIDDESGAELVDALRGYDNLSELSLGDNEIGQKSCDALGDLLSSPNAGLAELNLESNAIDDDGIASIANALADNASLKELRLSFNYDIAQDGWRTLFTCLNDRNSVLKTLDLSSTNLADEGAMALGNSLARNHTLKTLNLSDLTRDGMPLVTGVGWQGFFACLQSRGSALEEIDLGHGSIDGEGLSALTNSLLENLTVKTLNLGHNTQIIPTGWQSFFDCLKHPNIAIKELCLCGNNIGDGELAHLAQSLTSNATLETLDLGASPTITDAGWAPFRRLLCDTSSVESIRASNHALRSFGDRSVVPADLATLLQFNESDDKREVARGKVIEYHFRNGVTNMHEFLDMKLTVLPQAISSICGSDAARRSLLYELFRSMPSLFGPVDKAKVSGTKRKRQ